MPVQLEVGKYYRTRRGVVVGPIRQNDTGNGYFFRGNIGGQAETFLRDGYVFAWREDENDLIEEVPAPASPPFTLEAGKRYRSRYGLVVGPLVKTGDGLYCFTWKKYSFTLDGQYNIDRPQHPYDLVEEYVEPFVVQSGKYYRNRSGEIIGPLKLTELPLFPFSEGDRTYTATGHFDDSAKPHRWDLIEEVPAPGVQIKIGSYYQTKAGNIIGPAKLSGRGDEYPYILSNCLYTAEGFFYKNRNPTEDDLLHEVEVSLTPVCKPAPYRPAVLLSQTLTTHHSAKITIRDLLPLFPSEIPEHTTATLSEDGSVLTLSWREVATISREETKHA